MKLQNKPGGGIQRIQMGIMPTTKTTIALLSVLLLGGTAHAKDGGCYGEITVGHGWANVRNSNHNGPVCFFTSKWKRTSSRKDFPEDDVRQTKELCAAATGGNDRGLYCHIFGKFRKAKNGVPQLVKLRDVKVIDATTRKQECVATVRGLQK